MTTIELAPEERRRHRDRGRHMAALLKRAGGIPAHSNHRSEWDVGCRPGRTTPGHR
ncbi:hypothetical protein ACIBU0_07685 [Streptomyces sp. NPDC049627]|uniref:hypothetical protein n=1 Tax=Streptomyces sp. NPDC049627 TaxID=3365595 RepID=UPI00378B9536